MREVVSGASRALRRNHVMYSIRERPLMTSDFRVGRGVQNDPKKSDVID